MPEPFEKTRRKLDCSATYQLARLSGSENKELVGQFVNMMANMYEFHASLHPDWKPKPGWEKGSANWIEKGAGGKDWFFALAFPVSTVEKALPSGYIIASFHYEAPLFIRNRYGYIADLWVEPHSRGTGAANFLLEAASEFFKFNGVDRIQLEVMHNNAAGRRFWEKSGFETFEIIMRKTI